MSNSNESSPDDFASYLLDQAKGGAPRFHEFRLRWTENADVLHLFFEGDEDPLFYVPIVRAILKGKRIVQYVCKGKSNVEKASDLIGLSKWRKDCRFFVDRDHDELFGEAITPAPQLFETSGYSVENYLVTEEACRVVLIDVAGFAQGDDLTESTIQKWREAMDTATKQMRIVMAWALALRSEHSRAEFDRVTVGLLFNISKDGTTTRRAGGYSQLLKAGSGARPSFKAVRHWYLQLGKLESRTWARGKFMLFCFQRILLVLIAEVKAGSSEAAAKVRTPSALSQNRMFDLLGGRIGAPKELEEFLLG